MPALSSLQASKTRRILVYGPPKSGKTEFVGKLAEKYNIIWFDLENGKDTLFKLPPEWQHRINIINIPDSRTVPMAVETMLKVIKGGAVSICWEHGKVSCPLCIKNKPTEVEQINVNDLRTKLDTVVVVDSLTQLSNSCIANITRNKPEDYKLERDDWANLGKLMDMFLSHVQVAGFNIVCISHEIPVEMNDGKEKLVPVGGTKNFSRNTAKYFDDVLYCHVENKEHKVGSSTKFAMNILTGSRAGIVLDKSKEPKLLEMFV